MIINSYKDIESTDFPRTKPKVVHRNLYIPTELCEFAFTHKFIRPMQLYVYLKSICNGKIRLPNYIKKRIGAELKLKSVRAVNNNLRLLRTRNWVGFNKESGYYFIRGFNKVKEIERKKRRTSAEFKICDITQLKVFMAAAVITKLIRHQDWKERRKRELEPNKGGSKHRSRRSRFLFPVANMALARILKVSISTAFLLKEHGQHYGYLHIEKKFKKVYTGKRKMVPSTMKNQFKKAYPEIAHKVRVRASRIQLQDIDNVCSTIRLKRRGKKSKHT